MSKIDEAVAVLAALGLPHTQQNERSGWTLLAPAKLGPDDPWANVQRPLLRIWDIMGFMREVHGKDYAANSRETIRRQTIHQFEQAGSLTGILTIPTARQIAAKPFTC